MSKKTLPLVAICGRPNVGKSTLYNRIIGKQRAIVHSVEGITRDRHMTVATWREWRFRVVDTGGIVESPIDPVIQKMQHQVREALKEAKVIVFVLDGQEEITRIDELIREELFSYGTAVVVAVNKLDNPTMELNKHEFHVLGLGEPIAISSTHGMGVETLMEEVTKHFPPESEIPEVDEEEEDLRTKVAIVGKPNVGKSSFINAILNENRTIVDEKPGTTRDAIDIDFRWKDKDYLLIDTAGMRKKAGIREKVEYFSVARSLRAVRRADVCLVMVDAVDGITEQDKRVLNYVNEQGKGMVLVWTKWDLVEDPETRFKSLSDDIDLKMPFLKYVPFLTISNLTRQRLFAAFKQIDLVAAETEKRISTGELNRFMEGVKRRHKPSQKGGKHAKILYATQIGVKPTTFVLFVNQKRLFHFSYVRYIENQLRGAYGFHGVPLRIELREGKPKP